ncbi:MAG TPA: glycosyltransferase [Thermoleophilaceae bacterium]|nr:glycosyltransferase [Thermoleophilaceae bacterium]
MPAVVRDLLASPLGERYALLSIPTYRSPAPLARVLLFSASLLRLGVWCLLPGARIVHIHTAVRGSLYRKSVCVLVAKAARRPVVLHLHAGAGDIEDFHGSLGRLRRLAFRAAMRASDRVLSVSKLGADAIERLFDVPGIVVVPNAAPSVGAAELARSGQGGAPYVLYLGGFADPAKGGQVLVDALPGLVAGLPEARFVLAGPGEPPEALRALERQSEQVHWAGWLEEPAKREALRDSDVFVLPSVSEGLPVALLEAMAWGKALVATRVGGMPEVITDGTDGVLVASGEPGDLAEAVRQLVADPDRRRRLGAAARREADSMSQEVVCERLDRIYSELAGEGAASSASSLRRSIRPRRGALRGRSPSAVFLGYHSVADHGPPFLSVPGELFERQLDLLLERGFRSGDLAALREAAAGGRPRAKRAFLAFDDGFVDNYTEALPRMSARGLTGMVFVLPGHLDGGAPLDWPEVAGATRAFPDVMRSMTWPMAEAMAESGWEVGAHTLTHPHLPRLDDEQLTQELLDSRRRVEERLGSCALLAYPFGDWDARVALASARAGYEFAFTLPYGQQLLAGRMSIPRVTVDHRDDERRLARKLSTPGRELLFSPVRPVVRKLLGRGEGVTY